MSEMDFSDLPDWLGLGDLASPGQVSLPLLLADLAHNLPLSLKTNDARLAREGYDPVPELHSLCKLIDLAVGSGVRIVFHNANFDVRALNLTAERHILGRRVLDPAEPMILCTMQHSKPKLALKDILGRPKQPSNSELYLALHGSHPPRNSLHTALGDAKITWSSYHRARRLGWW